MMTKTYIIYYNIDVDSFNNFLGKKVAKILKKGESFLIRVQSERIINIFIKQIIEQEVPYELAQIDEKSLSPMLYEDIDKMLEMKERDPTILKIIFLGLKESEKPVLFIANEFADVLLGRKAFSEAMRNIISLAKFLGNKTFEQQVNALQLLSQTSDPLKALKNFIKQQEQIEKDVRLLKAFYNALIMRLNKPHLKILEKMKLKIYQSKTIVVTFEGAKKKITMTVGKLIKIVKSGKIDPDEYLTLVWEILKDDRDAVPQQELYEFYNALLSKVKEKIIRGEVSPFSDPEMEDAFYFFLDKLQNFEEIYDKSKLAELSMDPDFDPNFTIFIDKKFNYAFIPSSVFKMFVKGVSSKKLSEALRITNILIKNTVMRVIDPVSSKTKPLRFWILDLKALERYGVKLEEKEIEQNVEEDKEAPLLKDVTQETIEELEGKSVDYDVINIGGGGN